MLMGGVAGLALLGAGWFGYDYITVGRYLISTDDAYVRAYNTTLGVKVSGYVSEFLVDDNVKVFAGDVIARIDDGDYRLAVDAARDKIATQQATIERFDRQIAAQRAAVEQAQAQLVSAQAGQKRMQLEFERQQALAGRDFASRQTLEQSIANRDQANAAVQSAQAAIDGAVVNVDVLQAQQKEAVRTLDELKTALAKAERDLSFTEIRAPVDGVVGNRAAQPGDFVQTGQRIAALVPLSDVFIDANFKETQLGRLQPGQPVSIRVDALPGESVNGVVASVSPASGAVFSLLPPDNATGNFTKIVQRLPVRIKVPADVAQRGALRPGMSVVVSVNTKADAAGTPVPHIAAN
jgi:membrane fusion protein (multidrug efflux system)